MNFRNALKDSNIIIALHEYTRVGPGHDLRQFLKDKEIKNLIFITHPLLYVKESYQKKSHLEHYLNGELKYEIDARHWRIPEVFLYIKDFLYTIYWVLSKRMRFRVFVGLDPLNAFSGIILRQLYFVEKTVYYSIDYFPNRFENPVMNKIYHLFDKFAVRFSDETWNVGARMAKARQEYGNMIGKNYLRQHVMPIGVWLSKLKRKKDFNPQEIVYVGHLVDYAGVDLAIKALPLLKKSLPKIRLKIIGRGPEEDNLKKLSKKLGVEKNIKFYNWIENRQELIWNISGSTIGIATFNTEILDDKVRNADPGKIKDYMVAGLPIIVTKAIYNYKKIQNNSCGIAIDFNVKQFAKAAERLMKNSALLKKYKNNSLLSVSKLDWEILFTKALSRLLVK